MGNKKIPDEVVTAMDHARAAGWPVSNRNKMIHIIAPDGVKISIGHNPNDESMKVFRSTCRTYNLIEGPARTRKEVEQLLNAAEKEGLAEAERLNAKRKAYEAEQRARQQQIKAAQEKAAAATQQGMIQPEEKTITMPSKTDLFPTFDADLLGTKDNSHFLLSDGTYYCIECLSSGQRSTFKAPQGLAAHRGVRHQMYPGNYPSVTQETSRVSLPADVDTALDMLRVAIAESLPAGADPQVLAAKEAELAEVHSKLAALAKEADADRAASDKRFEEAQQATDRALEAAKKEADAKREAEIELLMKNFMSILLQIKDAIENLSPIQAIAKIDTVLTENLPKQ